ncbi:hypothetical protein HCN44_005306 [Aphidius gifuensis]|uniref:Protein eyes shut n=2 Tax=Aphidius gifuensis TaxID=684658 RepID=A0A834Y4H4_APHGI|nr:hypothetical protein HCN44_005306 [Aphidius gifuensis]
MNVCNSTICKNNGDCIDGAGYSFYCQCQDGWIGEFCDDDVNECDNLPCQNSGTCINNPGSYTCACLFGFTGKDCDHAVIECYENPCYNNAMCLLENNETVCYCVPDYHGQLCELKYNDCESKFAKCDNGGTCIDGINNFTCSCTYPYGGGMCQDIVSTTTTTTVATTTVADDLIEKSTIIINTSQISSTELNFFTNEVTINSTDNQKTDFDDDKLTKNTTSYMTINDIETTTTATTSVFQYYDNSTNILTSTESPNTTIKSFNETATSYPLSSSASTTSIPSIEESTYFSNEITTIKDIPSSPRGISNEHQTTVESLTYSSWTDASTTDVDFDTFITMQPVTITDNLTSTIRSTSATKFTSDISTMYSTSSTKIGNNCSTNSNDKNQCDCSTSDCYDKSNIKIAAFNGKSYIRQQIKINENGILKIYLMLKTKSKNGIILHAFFDEERFILLYMEFGQLKFQFSCGLQTMLLGEIDTPINDGNNITIEIKFSYLIDNNIGKCLAKLFVNNTMAMSGEQMLSLYEAIPHEVRLHLGGIPQVFSHYFPSFSLGFIGCMSNLIINDIEKSFIYDSVETYQIDECTSFLCLLNPCKNFGSCNDYKGKIYCNCIAGYTGDMCEKTACDDNPCYHGSTCISSPGTGFICVCPIGMHGLLCEQASVIVQPSFSVFKPGFSSYAAYGIDSDIKNEMEINMRISPQSIDQISLIAFIGQGRSSHDITDHFAVTYVKGYIMLTWDLGSGVRRIFTPSPLTMRAQRAHNLRIGRRGREAWLSVDGITNVTGQAVGTMTQLDVAPILYIGGHKSRNFENLPHDLPLHTGFTGCIFDVEIRSDNSVISLTKSSPVSGRGVGECHRNECFHNSCKNGAVCLNHGPTYSCICMKEWQGPECNTPLLKCSSTNPSCNGFNI